MTRQARGKSDAPWRTSGEEKCRAGRTERSFFTGKPAAVLELCAVVQCADLAAKDIEVCKIVSARSQPQNDHHACTLDER